MIGLDKKQFSYFIKDVLYYNSITFGGFIDENYQAQKIAGRIKIDFISTTDLIEALEYININNTIYIGGERGAFFYNDPFQHPKFNEFLELINKKAKKTFKIITTNSINNSNYDVIKNSNLNLIFDINTFNKENDNYYNIIDTLQNISENIFKINFLFNGDMNTLKKDIDILLNINNNYAKKHAFLKLPEFSRFHSNEDKELHFKALENWEEAIKYFNNIFTYPLFSIRDLNNFPEIEHKEVNIDYYSFNIKKARENFLKKINDILIETENRFINPINICFLLPESSYSFFKENFPESNAILVKNLSLGGSYTVSGLLNRNDIYNAVLKNRRYNLYVAPINMFDKKLRDLNHKHALDDYPFNFILG